MAEIPGAERRKVEKKLLSPTIEPVAEGVWVIRGGGPPKRTMNVYLLQDGDGFTADDRGFDFSKLESRVIKIVMPRLLKVWDGGPVKIADTVSDGDDVAGFTVKHTPGHAPGLISLWRESDRLAPVRDTPYTP